MILQSCILGRFQEQLVSPRSGQDEKSVPHGAVFRYEWKQPKKVPIYTWEGEGSASIRVEEEVWMNPPDAVYNSVGKGHSDRCAFS